MGRLSFIIVLFVLALTSCMNDASGSAAGNEIRSLLHSTDCTTVWTRRAFSIEVLGKSFPVSRGFDFHGFENGEIVFRKAPNANDPVRSGDPQLSQSTAAIPGESRSFTSITYFVWRDDSPESEISQGFEVIEWDDLTLYYRRTTGGRVVTTVSHQMIAHRDGSDHALRITSADAQDIADIVGCSK